jgi:hypothetical protein
LKSVLSEDFFPLGSLVSQISKEGKRRRKRERKNGREKDGYANLNAQPTKRRRVVVVLL